MKVRPRRARGLTFIIMLLTPVCRGLAAPADSTATMMLEEVEITARGNGTPLKTFTDGEVRVDAGRTTAGIRTFGEADIIAALKLLPGIQSGSDYGSGLQVNGGLPSQILMTVDGAPVTYPYRFGGIFSTFNTPHFRNADFSRLFGKPQFPSRLGGGADFIPREPSAPEIQATAGLLCSSLTAGVRIKEKLDILLSGRISYLDHTIGPFINSGDTKISYDFEDLNLNICYEPSERHRLMFGMMMTGDRMRYSDIEYAVDTRMRWSNGLYYLGWEGSFGDNQGNGEIKTSMRIYHTRFRNTLGLRIPDLDFTSPSLLETSGGHLTVTIPLMRERKLVIAPAFTLESHRIEPMRSRASGIINFDAPQSNDASGTPLEGKLSLDLSWNPSKTLKSGLTGIISFYRNGGSYSRMDLSPRLNVVLLPGGGHAVTFRGGRSVQYLHQTGFSEIGLASNFWLPGSRMLPAQSAWNLSAGYTTPLLFNLLKMNIEGYWTFLRNEAEYDGRLLDITDEDYSPLSGILMTRGFNRGINISAELTGTHWGGTLAFGIGEGKRHSASGEPHWRAQTDPGASFTAAGSYRFNRNLSLSATFRYASGRPYTPVRRLYLIGGNLMKQVGKRNSRRLGDYQRLDLGLTWEFRKGIFHHLFNLSVLNAYGHRNVEMQTFVIDTEKMSFREKQYYSLYRFIPSISYTLSFKSGK